MENYLHMKLHGLTDSWSFYRLWDFTLAPEDMDQISNLNVGWRHLLWAETSMHNDYPFKDWLPSDYKLEKPGAGSTAGAK